MEFTCSFPVMFIPERLNPLFFNQFLIESFGWGRIPEWNSPTSKIQCATFSGKDIEIAGGEFIGNTRKKAWFSSVEEHSLLK